MKAVGFARLARHYYGLFGPRATLLLADRAARRMAPRPIYRLSWPHGPHGPSGNPAGTRFSPKGVVPTALDPAAFRRRFPGEVDSTLAAADEICAHRFDFLGTGPLDWGDPIRWGRDVRSGREWPRTFYTDIDLRADWGSGSDVKVPWELSRFHHAVVLAQAYLLSGDERYVEEISGQWKSWRRSNPSPYGVNWTSAMEVAIRAINLLYAAALISARRDDAAAAPLVGLAQGMREHGRFIERNLELGIGPGGLVAGNHYLANLCGLACIGLALPDLPEASRWARAGLSGLRREAEGVPADGLWWEGSTSYHRLAVEMFMFTGLVARRAGSDPDPAYWRVVERMCEAIMHLTRPDGAVPMVGDGDDGRLLITAGYRDWNRGDHRYLLALGAALFSRADMKAASGIAAPELFWLLGEDGLADYDAQSTGSLGQAAPSAHAFPQGGLAVVRGERPGDYALLRTGGAPPGAASAAHNHNDALSVELWIDGAAVTMDPGTLAYTSDPQARDEFRSTHSHATVSLDGGEQNRMVPGSPFELGIETDVELMECRSDRSGALVSATARWSGGRTHSRTVAYGGAAGEWRVTDKISGARTATWAWPLAPGRASLGARVETSLTMRESVEDFRVAPSYGVSVPSRVVRYEGEVDGTGRVDFVFETSTGSQARV